MSEPIQLREWLEVDTPQGVGDAIFVNFGEDENFWTVALREDGAVVDFKQQYIRLHRDYSRGRNFSHEDMAEILHRQTPCR